VLDVPALRERTQIDLGGDFSFDAVSPDGSRLYLIDYVAPGDPTRYTVRSYSVPAMRLDAAPVVDPRSPGEKMRGNPVSRAAGPGGRSAYTLYDGAGGTPFIHALDTVNATARCIDLDDLDPSIVDRLLLRMERGGRAVEVVDGRRELLRLDTRTFVVGTPRAASPWRVPALAGGLAAALAVAAAAWLLRRRLLVPDLAS